MSNNWAYELENKIYTVVSARAKKVLGNTYGTVRFTSTDISETNQLPCVYIHETASSETARDLDNVTINAVVENLQIDVWCKTSKNDCKKIIGVVLDEFKKLSFDIVTMPDMNNATDSAIYREIATVRRVISVDDNVV